MSSIDSTAQPGSQPPGKETVNAASLPIPWNSKAILGYLLLLTVFYALMLRFTTPLTWGDTIIYAPEIISYSHGQLALPRFFDFAHLFWRPLGYLLWRYGGFYTPSSTGWNQLLEVYSAFRVPSVILGYVALLSVFGIGARISRNIRTGAILAIAFLGWNACIDYFQVGTAYVPGMALQLAGLFVLLGARTRLNVCLAGVLLALSVTLWLPYLFGIPGVLLLAFFWNRSSLSWNDDEARARLRWLAQVVAVCALVGAAAFGAGMLGANVRSVAEAKAWITESRHGYDQGKNYLRVATGLPRSLIDVGPDGLLLKRFVLHDPYNPVPILDLVRFSLWKIALFYVGMAGLLWALLRDRQSRGVLLPLLLSSGVMIAFAVFFFEPGQSERWMPVFAVLVAAIAFAFRRGFQWQIGQIAVAALLAVAFFHNLSVYAATSDPGPEDPTMARMLAARAALAPHSMITLVTLSDQICQFTEHYPYHQFNREDPLPYYLAVTFGFSFSHEWRETFAHRAQEAWRDHGDIWVTKWLLSPHPSPKTGWAEGDDPQLKWADVNRFFASYDYDKDIGGSDGFMRMSPTPANQARLDAAAAASK
jgi:hypothetical protein